MPFLFTYGTIQNSVVQKQIVGRLIPMKPDFVVGFRKSTIVIDSVEYPLLIPASNIETKIKGSVMEISPSELSAFDAYEGSEYQRSLKILGSGQKAWVYHQ